MKRSTSSSSDFTAESRRQLQSGRGGRPVPRRFGLKPRPSECSVDSATAHDPEQLLTTGEAASLLGSSRQHVVDLCERGDLAYATVGRHRRVRRGDVDALRERTGRLTRDERRSLWLAYATAGRIVREPDQAVMLARENLDRMRLVARGQARRWLDEWEQMLAGPLERLLLELTSPSPKGRELRQNSPFAGLLADDERRDVLDAWRSRGR